MSTVTRPRPADNSTPYCGTKNGYYHHRRVLDEPACLVCCARKAADEKARRDSDPLATVKDRVRKRRYKGTPPERWRVGLEPMAVPA